MHTQNDGKPGVGSESKPSYAHPFRILLLVATSMFISEVVITFLFSLFPQMTPAQEGILDSSLLLIFIVPLLYIFFYRPFLLDIKERKKVEMEKEATIVELKKAMDEIKILKGLIPICAKCKKVRDDAGYWQHIEVYVRERSEAEFSHGICPSCAKELYPGLTIPELK
jgi:hypothetical protein